MFDADDELDDLQEIISRLAGKNGVWWHHSQHCETQAGIEGGVINTSRHERFDLNGNVSLVIDVSGAVRSEQHFTATVEIGDRRTTILDTVTARHGRCVDQTVDQGWLHGVAFAVVAFAA